MSVRTFSKKCSTCSSADDRSVWSTCSRDATGDFCMCAGVQGSVGHESGVQGSRGSGVQGFRDQLGHESRINSVTLLPCYSTALVTRASPLITEPCSLHVPPPPLLGYHTHLMCPPSYRTHLMCPPPPILGYLTALPPTTLISCAPPPKRLPHSSHVPPSPTTLITLSCFFA